MRTFSSDHRSLIPPGTAPAPVHDLWLPPTVDRELLARYDRPGPRYTSYPTAPQFTPAFDRAGYRRALRRSADAGAPLSVYLHIPFCQTRCFFCGCNVAISRNRERAATYLDHLLSEMSAVASALDASHREVVQIHWGGGTPTFLSPDQLRRVGRALESCFSPQAGCEHGVEVDPRHCDGDQLEALAELGVNRLSLGVQDLDPRVQAAINRRQPLAMTRDLIHRARELGIHSLNLDLIYGLPFQTTESFRRTLDRVVELEPDRLAVFNFAYLPRMLPHQRVIDPETLPDSATRLRLLELAIERLTAAGYLFIGLDHFARPQDPLAAALRDGTLTRNFQGYSTGSGVDLVGLGSSAIGHLGGAYAQNLKAPGAYQEALARDGLATERGRVSTPEDDLRREVIVGLMCQLHLDKRAIEAAHGIDFDRHFSAELRRLETLEADGLVTLDRESVRVTSPGRLLVRNVAMVFDAYLSHDGPGTGFSRTV